MGIRPAGADGDEPALRLDDISLTGDDERGSLVRHRQQRLKAAQNAVGAPVLGQFHRGAREMPLMFFQLALEALEQREGIGGAAGKAGNHLILVQAADLARVRLHDGVAHGHLAVAADDDTSVAAYR